MSLTETTGRALLSSQPKARPRRNIWGLLLLALPAGLFLVGFFALPVVLVLAQSFYAPDPSLDNYIKLFTSAAYLNIVWVSLKIAIISTVISTLLSYPLAYGILVAPPTMRAVMMAVVLLPFWTNILIRCYAWILLLQNQGIANTMLVDWAGIVDAPLPMVFNLTGVIVGMVHYLVPMNTLILLSSMQTVDLRLVRAAQGFGANPLRAFATVFVPLTMPGVQAAATLIFVISLGFYVTPAVLGGRGETTISMLISTFFTEIMDWGFGATLSVLLVAITLVGLSIYYTLNARQKRKAGGR